MTVGHLVGTSWRDFDVRITDEAIERFGIASTVLSRSIPLVPQPQRGRAYRRRNFFAEALPEGGIRERLAQRAGVAPTDTLGLLLAYGRDAAGAVSVIDMQAPDSAEPPRAIDLTQAQVGELLANSNSFPLDRGIDRGKDRQRTTDRAIARFSRRRPGRQYRRAPHTCEGVTRMSGFSQLFTTDSRNCSRPVALLR